MARVAIGGSLFLPTFDIAIRWFNSISMEPSTTAANLFLEKLSQEVELNLTNDQFGVEELSRKMGMSRSQLHRKLNAATGQSVSQFIREYRLHRGMDLLRKGDLTAAEVADRIGFGSATYFNKCFTELYGFPPGEVKKAIQQKPITNSQTIDTPASAPLSKQHSSRNILIAGFIFVVVALATYFIFTNKSQTAESSNKSIAILPFKNLSEDQSNEYFSEGVVEAIRTGLSTVRDLTVISRTSVEQYRQSPKRASEIAEELKVGALLEGSIRRNGNQVRIEVRLVDGETEALVWAKTYERDVEDVFAIQNEIAAHVADELNAKLSPEERSRLARAETNNPRAYDLYLQAKYEYRTYTNKGAHNSIELLNEAVQLDPGYARAYAFLGTSYFGLATIWGAELSALEALRKGKPLLDKALELDPHLDEAHSLLGFYLLYHDWNFEAAEAEYKMGIVNGHPDGLAVYIDYLNFMRRHKEALTYAEQLNEKEPYYPNSRIVHSYFFNHREDEALEFSEKRLELFNNYSSLDAHGFLLLNTGRYKESIEYFNKAIALEGRRYPRMVGWMGAAYARSGNEHEATKLITELTQRLHQGDKGSVSFFIAVIYSALDEKPAALHWLNNAYEAHDMEMPWLVTEPQLYNLHNHPDFQKLARKIGFRESL